MTWYATSRRIPLLVCALTASAWAQIPQTTPTPAPRTLESGAWRYHGTLQLPGQSGDTVSAARVDFSYLLASEGGSGTVSVPSIRLAEIASDGRILAELAHQFVPDAGFNPKTRAAGTLIWRIPASEPLRPVRIFRVFFDVEENGPWPRSPYVQEMPAPNLVENGGFEQTDGRGQPHGPWSFDLWSGATVAASGAYSGSRFVELKSPHIGWSSSLMAPGPTGINIEPGVEYRITLALRGTDDESRSVFVFLDWRDGNRKLVARQMIADGIDAPASWQVITAQQRAPANAALLFAVVLNTSSTGFVGVDDVNITPVTLPEFKGASPIPVPSPPAAQTPAPAPAASQPSPDGGPRATVDRTSPEPIAEPPKDK